MVLTDAHFQPSTATNHTRGGEKEPWPSAPPRPEAAKRFERTVWCLCTLSKPLPAASFLPRHKAVAHKCLEKPKCKGWSRKVSAPRQELTSPAGTLPPMTGKYFLEFCVTLGPALSGSWGAPAAKPREPPAVPDPPGSPTPTFGTCGIYFHTSAAAGSIYPKQPQIQLTD